MRLIRFGTDPDVGHWTDHLPRNLVTDLVVDQWEKHKDRVVEDRLRKLSEEKNARRVASGAPPPKPAYVPQGPPAPGQPIPLQFVFNVPPPLTATPAQAPMMMASMTALPNVGEPEKLHAGNVVATGIISLWGKYKQWREDAESAQISARFQALAAEKAARREVEAIAMKKQAEAQAIAAAEATKKVNDAKLVQAAKEAANKAVVANEQAKKAIDERKTVDARAVALVTAAKAKTAQAHEAGKAVIAANAAAKAVKPAAKPAGSAAVGAAILGSVLVGALLL